MASLDLAFVHCSRKIHRTPVDSCSAVKVHHASVNCIPTLDPTHCFITCHQGYTLNMLSGLGFYPQQVRDSFIIIIKCAS